MSKNVILKKKFLNISSSTEFKLPTNWIQEAHKSWKDMTANSMSYSRDKKLGSETKGAHDFYTN